LKKIFIVILLVLGFFILSSVISFILGTSATEFGDKIAVIPVNGVIITSDAVDPFSFGGSVSSGEVVENIKNANERKAIKAIILEIDSPGGTVVGTREIASAVQESEKPVVAWIRDVGASGGFWIATTADTVVADPLSMVGSIGVTSSYLEFSELLGRYGVSYERLVSGESKDMGTPFRPLGPSERERLLERLEVVHKYFIQAVAENRDLSEEEVQKFSNGAVMLGIEAQEAGFVDELGNFDTAFRLAKELSQSPDAEIASYGGRSGLLDFFGGLSSSAFYNLGRGMGVSLRPQVQMPLLLAQ